MKCSVIELLKSEDKIEFNRWLSDLDQAGFFSQTKAQTSGSIFTQEEQQQAADFFINSRCCNSLETTQHTDGNEYCLFHLPTFEKDVGWFENAFRAKLGDLEKWISSIPYFAENEQKLLSIKYAYDFSHYFFPNDLTFSDYIFKTPFNLQSANFYSIFALNNCRFLDKVDFTYANFEYDFKIQDCHFSKTATFQKGCFKKTLKLVNTTFSKDANFASIQIHADIDAEDQNERVFENLIFEGVFDINGINWEDKVKFKNIKFLEKANFSNLTLDKQIFENVTFEKDAIFKNTNFFGEADFNSFVIKGKVDCRFSNFARYYRRFDNLTFPAEVDFTGAKFPLGMILYRCNFEGNVSFDSAEFGSTTQITQTKFKGDASFVLTKFNWHTYFNGSEFYQNTFFGADFEKQTQFIQTVFLGETQFGSKKYENNFNSDTSFNSAKFIGKTDFSGSNFNHPTTFFEQVDFTNVFNLPIKVREPQQIMTRVDSIIYNIGQLVTCSSNGKAKKGNSLQALSIIQNGAIAIERNIIKDIGTTSEILGKYECDYPEKVFDAEGKVVMPAFVDPHTHIIYGGNRLDEFELKIKGADYLEILANGGGILSTVRHTREATHQELFESTFKRLDKMLAHGTATAEIKTGYGLDLETELKMMRVWEDLDDLHQIYLVPTFLPAHAVPPEFKNNSQEYVNLICEKMIPALLDWKVNVYADPDRIDFQDKLNRTFFVDVFCEKNAFDLAQTERILKTAKEKGFALKAHVDEFTNLGGSKLCIEMGAVSIDHLDAISDREILLLANSDTVGIVTPTVNFNFGSAHFANARKLIDSGCAIAVSTDYNPGSAPCPSQQTSMQIACRYQKILPSEAINATTINAAFSIGLGNKTGSLEVGKWADIIILDTTDYREVCYEFGGNFVERVFKNGNQVYPK